MSYPSNPDSFGINYVSKGYQTVAIKDKRINKLNALIGRKIKMDVPGEFKDSKRDVVITKLYPYHAQGTYIVGKEDGPKHIFKIGLSIADLLQAGLISYDRGYAEVI